MSLKTVQLTSCPVVSGTKVHNATANNQTWYLTLALVCTDTDGAMASGAFSYSTEGAFQAGFTFREGVPGANAGNMAGQYGAVPFSGAEVTDSGSLPASPGSGVVLWEQTITLTHHTGIYMTYHGSASWGTITYDDAAVGTAEVKCCYILQVDDPTYTTADLLAGVFATHQLVAGEPLVEDHVADTDAAHAATAIGPVSGSYGGAANLGEQVTWLRDNKQDALSSIDDIPNVVISGSAAGDLIRWTGTEWVNYPDSNYATSGHNHSGTYVPVGNLVTAYKTADETVTSSAALQDDDHLALAVAASATYALDGLFIISGSSAGDVRFNWSGPTGYAVDWTPGFPRATLASVTYDSFDWSTFDESADAYISLASSAGTPIRMMLRPLGTVVTSSTSGTLTLRWAQGTSNGTATTLFSGSWLRLTKLS